MGLIDRLRPQPRWKHAEAQIRLDAVRELGDDEQDILGSLAGHDPDSRVRQAAVARLHGATALAGVASADADPAVRADATLKLTALAIDAAQEAGGLEAARALAGVGDERALLQAAKGAFLEAVSRVAADALHDTKMLSAVARQSRHEAVARAALDRLYDRAELANVALRSEHREVALAALDRVTDRDTIEQVASRAKHKAVVRRARALLRPSGESEPPVDRVETPFPSGPIDEAIETPVVLEPDVQLSQTPDAIAHPAAPAADTPMPGPTAEVQELTHAEQPSPPAVEQPSLEVAAPPAPETPTASELAERLGQLTLLIDGAEQVLSATDLPDARTRWNALRRDWAALLPGLHLDEAVAARVKAVEARIDARETELREARSRQQHDNLAHLHRLCEQLEKLAQAEPLTLRDAERALRDARAALDAPGPLPSRQDQQAIVGRLKSVQSLIFPRVQDLREADEWERWANAGVQDSLIRRLEALREEADPAVMARQLRYVQDEWHKVRTVPREKGRELWQRYKTVEAEIRGRCESFYQQMATERAESLKAKELLCEQVEAIADSTDWIRVAETIKGVQAQWKAIGAVTPGHEKAIWERFRAACDRFFTRRKQDLTERKTVWAANLQKKEAICAAIEALADTTDWDRALGEVKRFQTDWRTVGPIKRSRAESLLLRFRTACEHFFDIYAHRNDQEVAQQAAAREKVCDELDALLPAADDSGAVPAPPDALVKTVIALKRQWEQAPTLPRPDAQVLADRFAHAMNRLIDIYAGAFSGTDLDPEANRKRMEQLCQMVEGFAGEEKADERLSPAAILATQWRDALAANTIGGRVDDEAKWRNTAEEVRKAQAAWRRIGPVPEATARDLSQRFQRACARFFRQREQKYKPSSTSSR